MDQIVRKIVAVGGGGYGRIDSEGKRHTYELAGIDREIVRLSGKEKPHFLLLTHALASYGPDREAGYYEAARVTWADTLGCELRWLKASDLTEHPEMVKEYIEWADIVYECGGNTVAMIAHWRETGFDACLKKAWEAGKVMCGASAGGICWFALGNSGTPELREAEVNKIEGLGFIDAYFSPHCHLDWKRTNEIRSLKHIDKVGLSVTNCAAVEIVGDGYRALHAVPADNTFKPYVLRTYWKNGEMFEEEIPATESFRPLREILNKE